MSEMPKHIDADALKKRFDLVSVDATTSYEMGINTGLYRAYEEVELAPAADVVEVVRCRDCVHWGDVTFGFICRKFSGIDSKICMWADHFCSYGERREEQ